MKKIMWYLAWLFSATAGILMLIAVITSLAGVEFLRIKWYTYWYAVGNFTLFAILAVLLYTQLGGKAKEEK